MPLEWSLVPVSALRRTKVAVRGGLVYSDLNKIQQFVLAEIDNGSVRECPRLAGGAFPEWPSRKWERFVMAYRNCTKEVSLDARRCPHCGCNYPTYSSFVTGKLKRIGLAFLAM